MWPTRSVPPNSRISQAQVRSDVFEDGGGIREVRARRRGALGAGEIPLVPGAGAVYERGPSVEAAPR
ncbi:hypothetical protein WMF27_23085 [Sorangium sp. So ce281]